MLPLPPVTKALMLICTAIFFADQLFGNSFSLGEWFALWPLNSGAFYPWQLVSYAFLHGEPGASAVQHDRPVDVRCRVGAPVGQKRYWQMLLAGTLTAAVAQLLVTLMLGSNTPTVGASGALFGLLLAYALVFPRRQFDLIGFLPMVLMMIPGQIFYTLGVVLFVLLIANRQLVPLKPLPVPALTTVMIFGAIELFLGVTYTRSGVAHFAHLGGMLGAWLLLLYWRGRLRSAAAAEARSRRTAVRHKVALGAGPTGGRRMTTRRFAIMLAMRTAVRSPGDHDALAPSLRMVAELLVARCSRCGGIGRRTLGTRPGHRRRCAVAPAQPRRGRGGGCSSQAVDDARSNATLGRDREGSGVVIGADGLVLTIGYLDPRGRPGAADHRRRPRRSRRAWSPTTWPPASACVQPLAPLRIERRAAWAIGAASRSTSR